MFEVPRLALMRSQISQRRGATSKVTEFLLPMILRLSNQGTLCSFSEPEIPIREQTMSRCPKGSEAGIAPDTYQYPILLLPLTYN